MQQCGRMGFRIVTNAPRPDAGLVEGFQGIASSNLADAMGRFGFMDSGIRRRSGGGLCGVAVTVNSRPGDNLMVHKAMSIAQAGAWFAERWQLPSVLIAGIGEHHSDSEDSMSEMIRVAEQAALNADLGLYGERKEAALNTDLGMYGKRKQVPVEQQEEVEAYIRSKGDEIDVFFRMTSKPAA